MALIVSEQMQQRKKLKFQRELKRHLSSFTSDELKTNIQKMFKPSVTKPSADAFYNMMLASKFGNANTVSCICENDASINLEDEHGDTALHYAALGGHYEVISILVTHGAKMDIKNTTGESAARIAFRMGHAKCLECLCAADYYEEERPVAPPVRASVAGY